MDYSLNQLHVSDINRVKIFMTVVECGGFIGAQQKLGLSAASISLHMSGLEERLGIVLCNRGRSGFWLTTEGKQIYKAGQNLMLAQDRFNSAVGEAKGKLTGDLRLGVIDNSVFDTDLNIPTVLSEFRKLAPDIQISLYTMTPSELEQAILEQRLHLAIGVFYERSPVLDYQPFNKEKLRLYCGKSHPLYSSEKRNIKTSMMHTFEFVERTYGTTLSRLNKPVKFNTAAYTSSLEAALLLILSGNYIGFLPRYYAQHWVNQNQIKAILENQLFIETEISVLTHKTPENAAITQIVRELFFNNNS